MDNEDLVGTEKPDLLEKHKTLFEVGLKNISLPQLDKDELAIFVEHSIESLFFLYLMWHTHERVNVKSYKGMTKRSVWFFLHGMLLQRFIAKKWAPELASTVSESIVVYIVSQAYDLFSIRSGLIKVN